MLYWNLIRGMPKRSTYGGKASKLLFPRRGTNLFLGGCSFLVHSLKISHKHKLGLMPLFQFVRTLFQVHSGLKRQIPQVARWCLLDSVEGRPQDHTRKHQHRFLFLPVCHSGLILGGSILNFLLSAYSKPRYAGQSIAMSCLTSTILGEVYLAVLHWEKIYSID